MHICLFVHQETELNLESCRQNLTHLTDDELLRLLFKVRLDLRTQTS